MGLANRKSVSSASKKKVSKKIASKKKASSKKIKKLSRKGIDSLIVEHRDHGRRLAWSFLSGWRGDFAIERKFGHADLPSASLVT